MMTRYAMPTRQRLVGWYLRDYRESAGYDLADAARVLGCNRSKISRIETGQRGIPRRNCASCWAPVEVGDGPGDAQYVRRPGVGHEAQVGCPADRLPSAVLGHEPAKQFTLGDLGVGLPRVPASRRSARSRVAATRAAMAAVASSGSLASRGDGGVITARRLTGRAAARIAGPPAVRARPAGRCRPLR
jgi:DNA-binding XRE family transcriptional regulator